VEARIRGGGRWFNSIVALALAILILIVLVVVAVLIRWRSPSRILRRGP
jgi:hypothetical protein